jgi:hypothetical protein
MLFSKQTVFQGRTGVSVGFNRRLQRFTASVVALQQLRQQLSSTPCYSCSQSLHKPTAKFLTTTWAHCNMPSQQQLARTWLRHCSSKAAQQVLLVFHSSSIKGMHCH